jgi:branched-chain amino acid transport system substrate-binding protein
MSLSLRPLLVVLAIVATIGIPHALRADDPYELLTFESLTGPAAFSGRGVVKTLEAVEALTNRTGGIRGRRLKVVVEDDQSSPQVAVQIMTRYLAKKPAVIMGGLFGALCNAALGLVTEAGPVLYCYSPSVRPAPGSWVYSTSFSTLVYYSAGLRYFQSKGLTKIALLTSTDATGVDADKTYPEIFAQPEYRNMTLVTKEYMGLADISIAAQMERIKASGAQGVVAWVSGTPFGTVLRGIRDSGLQLPVYASGANASVPQLEGYKSIWPNTLVFMGVGPAVVPEAISDRTVRRKIDEFLTGLKSVGVDRPGAGEATAWDAAQIVVDALRRRGPDATPAQIRDHINGIRNWPGIFGKFDYQASPQRGVQGDWFINVRWDPDGSRFVPISKPGGASL